MRAKDTEAFYPQFDRLLRALRWSPEFLNDTGSTITLLATTISPDSAGELRDLMITICENFPDPSPENLRRLQLYHTLALIDSDRHADALPIADKFFEVESGNDPIKYSMVRLRAIAASRVDGADLEISVAALEEVLAGKQNDGSRVQNVLQLASLYHQLDRHADEEALLARELVNPAIRANEGAFARLSMRHRALAREGSGAKNFSAAVGAWLDAHAPAWLASCPPQDLGDVRIGENIELAIEEAASRFTPEETIKLNLLAARSDRLSLRDRERAFLEAFTPLLSDAATHQQVRAMLETALGQEGFPKSLKQLALFAALDDAIAQRRAGDVAFVLAHPSLDRDNDALSGLVEIYGHLAAADFSSADSLRKTAMAIAADGLSDAELAAVMQCFQRLLELGELAAAEEIYQSSRGWKLEPDVRVTNNAIKLKLLKILKYARKTIPITHQLHAELAPMLELDKVVEPEWFSQRHQFADTADLSLADARAMRLYQVKSKRFDQADPQFWFDVAEAIQGPESTGFACKLLEIYLRQTSDDGRRSAAAFLAPGIVDTDEPDVRERLREIFAPYRDLADSPLTRDAIRIYEIQTDKFRAGLPVDIDQAFKDLTHPAARNLHTRTKLTQLIQQEDKPELRRYLERMSADQMLDDDFLTLTIPALDLAGLEDEAELARETAAEKIPALVAEGWRSPWKNSLRKAYHLAIILEQPERIPHAALDDLLAHGLKNERRQLGLKMIHHQLHRDWPKLEAAASQAVEQFPTFYSFYLEKARALYHQDKKHEAIGPLKVFLKYSGDDPEFTKAKRWLEEAQKAE